ncbi:hypothetical protein [Candidatus Cyanaurora vandensis]|uniref:hypothetical protein n=1 Tax=Candidatus Cyanaurora vandensis TaxID=2714958 RepID=UPI00257BD7D1|nr:hypothetical protein [Candidatus Cyanaurora vandensis]
MAKKEKITPHHKQGKTGRPRKFEGPTQNFYITLPLEVVEKLKAVDEHLATAIVKLTSGAGLVREEDLDDEVAHGILPVVVGPEQWAISVPDSPLGRLSGVRLVPYQPGRWLLALEASQDPRDLELNLRDLLERELTEPQRYLLRQIVNQLSQGRRQGGASTLHLLLYRERLTPSES